MTTSIGSKKEIMPENALDIVQQESLSIVEANTKAHEEEQHSTAARNGAPVKLGSRDSCRSTTILHRGRSFMGRSKMRK